MHRTTLNLPESLHRKAKIKAATESVPLSEVIRLLLARWVAGEARLQTGELSHREMVAKARETFGIWKDRDPDAYLKESRKGLGARDRETEDARLAP